MTEILVLLGFAAVGGGHFAHPGGAKAVLRGAAGWMLVKGGKTLTGKGAAAFAAAYGG